MVGRTVVCNNWVEIACDNTARMENQLISCLDLCLLYFRKLYCGDCNKKKFIKICAQFSVYKQKQRSMRVITLVRFHGCV